MKIESLLAAILALIVCLCSGCGGGSKGTGGETFKGALVNNQGAPVPNISVVLPESGDETFTDAQGRFSLHADFSGNSVEVLLEGEDFSVTIYIDDVPPGTQVIVVTFALLRTGNSVIPSIQAIEFQ